MSGILTHETALVGTEVSESHASCAAPGFRVLLLDVSLDEVEDFDSLSDMGIGCRWISVGRVQLACDFPQS